MTPEVKAICDAARELTRERDSGPAGYILTHHLIPAVLAYLAALEANQ